MLSNNSETINFEEIMQQGNARLEGANFVRFYDWDWLWKNLKI